MSVPSMFRKFLAVFNRKELYTVKFYLVGGQVITLHGVEKITVSKGSDNRYNSYNIEWAEGYKPALFSVALDDISAVVAEKE